MLRVTNVVGARPNFMKIAPIVHQLARRSREFASRLVHTGQHYDREMSRSFFEELDIPWPDVDLECGSGSHAEQTARIMVAFERELHQNRPDLVIVVGDVNSTMACAIVAKKLHVAVAHVEAGLRSYDMTMPEEVNRKVTDAIADLLFTPSADGDANLLKEGVDASRIYLVGNVMIDCMMAQLPKLGGRATLAQHGVTPGAYATMTLHRPSNVDDGVVFGGILDVIGELGERMLVVWPVHPRSRGALERHGLLGRATALPGLRMIDPLGYLDMLALNRSARLIVTDSGGLQEEATVLGVPCVTLRENTERPATVEAGANEVAGTEPDGIRGAISRALAGDRPPIRVPPLWDGRAAERIVEALAQWNQEPVL